MRTRIGIIEPDTGAWLWTVETFRDGARTWWEIYHEGALVAQAYTTGSGRAYKALKPQCEIPDRVYDEGEVPEQIRDCLRALTK